MKITKESLILIKQWNDEEFKKFYLQNVDMFFRWLKWNYSLNDDDCKDILSEFFLKLWNNKKNIPLQNYKNWIWTIFKNTLKDWFKRKKLISFSYIQHKKEINIEENILSDEDINKLIDKNFKLEKIKEALKQLEDIYQDVIFLKFIENKSNQEIAEILWISQDNVRQRISRAIKKLEVLLN